MTDDVTTTPVPDREPPEPAAAPGPPGGRRSSADVTPRRPAYKGEELDPARGPGLGCFWFQAAVLTFFLALIPIGVKLNWPFEVLAALLFVALGLLLFVGQTLIFLLRLVAADRRDAGRRRPLASPTPTVGQLEDALLDAPGTTEAAGVEAPGTPEAAGVDAIAPDGVPPAPDGAESIAPDSLDSIAPDSAAPAPDGVTPVRDAALTRNAAAPADAGPDAAVTPAPPAVEHGSEGMRE